MGILNQQMEHKLKVCNSSLVVNVCWFDSVSVLPPSAHIRGTYKGRIIEERDVTFEYGEGMEAFIHCQLLTKSDPSVSVKVFLCCCRLRGQAVGWSGESHWEYADERGCTSGHQGQVHLREVLQPRDCP